MKVMLEYVSLTGNTYCNINNREMKMDGIIFILFLGIINLSISTVTQDPNLCGVGECCLDYFLEDGICTACSSGRHGKNCSKICPTGFYGRQCKMKCPSKCNKDCDKVTGLCQANNETDTSIEKQIEHFLKERVWVIAGVSSVLFVILCGAIGVIHFNQGCKCMKIRTIGNSQPTNQTPQSSYSVRYESDVGVLNNSHTPSGSCQTNGENRSTKCSSDRKEAKISYEYSKPIPKNRYSFIWNSSVSQEVTSCQDFSEDEGESEEFDDYTNTTGGVQISGLPQQQSLNTFQTPNDKKETDYGENSAYTNIWE